MKICYIAPILTTVTPIQEPTATEMNWMEKAMSTAIQSTIVEPFQAWCHSVWLGFVDVSLPICTATSLFALVLTLIGVKKAKQWVIIPIIVYLSIQVANYIMAGGK